MRQRHVFSTASRGCCATAWTTPTESLQSCLLGELRLLLLRRLTSVMADQLLQRAEGDPRRDVEPSVVQRSDLVVFDGVSGGTVPDGQRVASCAQTYRRQLNSSSARGLLRGSR